MKKLMCALIILSMLIIPAACQRTVPEGENTETQNITATPGWSPDNAIVPEEGAPEQDGETPAGELASADEPALVPDPGQGQIPVEIPVITEAVPDKAVKSISIKTAPKNTVFYSGSPIDTTGLTVNVTFTDGTTKTIAGGFGYSPAVASGKGTQKITVSYGGKTDTFSIKVKDEKLKSISIKTKPDRLTYRVNEKIDTAGMTLNAEYEGGEIRTVSSGFTCSPDSFDSVGAHSVKVSYGGKTTSFQVTVKTLFVTSIRVTSKPTRTSYYLNEPLDTKGMVLTVAYSDGTSKNITSGFKCTPSELTNKGLQKITVTYENKTASFNVNVKEDTVKGIEIKTGPKKVTYFEGEKLDTAGLSLTVDYENAPSKTITSGFACSPTLLNEPGVQTITVTYAGKKKVFNVRVKEDALEGIEITSGPAKRAYYVGDTLDTKGLSVRAVYISGRVETLTAADVTCSPSKFTAEGASVPVAVSYGGKTVHFGVKVNANPIKEIFVSQKPTKTYKIGDTVGKGDIEVCAKRENGKIEAITGFTIHNARLEKAGQNYIEITYGDYRTSLFVNAEDAVSEIYIERNPNKTDYKKGDKLDTTGLAVKAKYASGATATVTDSCSVSPRDLNGAGQQKVTVVYQGHTAYFYVTVTED